MKTRKLIRLWAALLAMAVCASVFTACNGGKDPGETIEETSEETTQADPREEKYAEAYERLENGDYEAAYALFVELGDYKDAAKEAAYFRYMPVGHFDEYVMGEVRDAITYTVTLNDQNLPATVVEEYASGLKHTCTFTHNEFGYVTRRECSNTEGITTLYEATYDEKGNLLTEAITTGDGNVSRFDCTYNEQGQLVSVVTTNAPDYYKSYTCTYDEEGRVIHAVYVYEEDTYIEETVYDAAGNILKMTWITEDGEVDSIYDYKYDEKGRLVEVAFTENGEDGGFRRLTYNDKDQVIREHAYYSFGYEYTEDNEYDEHGNVIKVTYAQADTGDGAYNDVTVSTYKLVYLPFDFTEDEWEAICDSTQCWDSTHW